MCILGARLFPNFTNQEIVGQPGQKLKKNTNAANAKSTVENTLLFLREKGTMPVITVEADKLSKEQKDLMARKLTQTAVEVLDLPKESIYVLIKELAVWPPQEWRNETE